MSHTPTHHGWAMACLSWLHIEAETNGRHFADDIFKCIFLNENVWIPIKISLKLVPKGPINNIPVLVQIMAWRRPGDEPSSEPMLVFVPTHICVTRPQWVNTLRPGQNDHNFADIFKCIFLKMKMKMYKFLLRFHWSLFARVQLTIFQHWFR